MVDLQFAVRSIRELFFNFAQYKPEKFLIRKGFECMTSVYNQESAQLPTELSRQMTADQNSKQSESKEKQ